MASTTLWLVQASAVTVGVLTLASCDGFPQARRHVKAQDSPEPKVVTLFEIEGEEITDPVQAQLDHLEPTDEEWLTEDLHARAKPVLAALVNLFTAHKPENFTGKILGSSFSGSLILPAELELLFDDGNMRIEQAHAFPGERVDAMAFPAQMKELVAGIDHEELHFKSKLYSMELDPDDASLFASDALVRLAGPTGTGGQLQINMEWRVGFHAPSDDEVRIQSIELVSYRTIAAKGELFADLTKHAFSSIPRFREDFLIGTGDYHFRSDRMNGNAYTGSMGLAIGDANGDGLDDLFVCQPGGMPNRLLIRRTDGSVDDRSLESRLNLLTKTQSALFVDLDNDGDQDLLMACKSGIVIGENDGRGRFTQPVRPLVASSDEITTLSAADYDQDGDLDIYACMYARTGSLGTTPVPYYDAVNGPPNHLWRNDGDWSFSNVTREVGLDENNVKFSYAAIWEDFDRDGDFDLYVANDFGRNNFYRNDDGTFRDVAREIGADDVAAGMGVTVADFDQNGTMDLYVTNMFSSAGRRIVPQSEFMAGENTEIRGDLLRHARGNTLLLNEGDGTFRDATEQGGSVIAGWGWGSKSLDLNNDGCSDIYAPNGWLTNKKAEDL